MSASHQGGVERQDRRVLIAGVIASVIVTAVIGLLSARLEVVPHGEDVGAGWYYWQLPERSLGAAVSAWGMYLAHQLSTWWIIARMQRRRGEGYTTRLWREHWIALGLTAGFVALRVIQTHVWYDGLAQHVSVWSALGSVAVLLIWVLILEAPRRGLLFGRVRLRRWRSMLVFARRYHGYYFAWAIIYTFWYHPTEGTAGHLMGLFYTLLLMLQGALAFTPIHRNKWWTLILELFVVVHGVTVAALQGAGLWPMFAFGFGGVFVITQMHGVVGSLAARVGVLVVYLAACIAYYGTRGGWDEALRIPALDYLGVLLLAGVLGLLCHVFGRLR